jgi:benzoyl-CoA reductase/2-hydroxyglutaryl-CoA dehydratase subunit BcrC/BadD/HgdB
MGKTIDLPKYREVLGIYKEALKKFPENPSSIEQAEASLFKTVISYLEETLKVVEEGDKPLVWIGSAIMPEIFMAMDLQQHSVTVLLALLAAVQPEAVKEYCRVGESAGLAPEMCAADKGVLGMLLSGGAMPIPDLFVPTTLPCDNLIIGYQIFQNFLNVPSFVLDAPHGDEEEDYAFYTNQLKLMISWLEERTGRKMDYDKLRELLEEANRAIEYWTEICDLRRTIPCPQSSRLLNQVRFAHQIALGKPDATAIFKHVRDDALERVKAGKGVVEDEKVRLTWFMVPLIADMGVYDWIEQELHASIPMDMFSYNCLDPIDTSTPDTMLRGLAKQCMNAPMARQLRASTDLYTDDLVRVCEDYKIDAVIFCGHEGCKMAWGSVGLIRDICREIDRPLLVFDVDAILASSSQLAEVRNRIKEFVFTVTTI